MEKRNDRKMREQLEAQMLKNIKGLVNENRYEEALDVVNQMDVGKIKVAPTLCLIGEVYMHEGMYDEAENVFVKAYDKSPSSRRILSLLTSLYIEKGDYSEAEYYYKEFIGVASRDVHRYILRYRLDKAKGERMSVLIDTLERLKDYEYIEEWAFELAELYHKAGDDKKAVRECDEIVLWFGHGKFVNKAITLKCLINGEPVPFMDEDDEDIYSGRDDDHVSGLTDSSIDIDMIEKALRQQETKKQSPVSETSDSVPVIQNDTGMVSKEAAKQYFDTLTSLDTSEFWKNDREDDPEVFSENESDEDFDEILSENEPDEDFDEIFSENESDEDFDEIFSENESDEDFDEVFSENGPDDDFVEEDLEDSDVDEFFVSKMTDQDISLTEADFDEDDSEDEFVDEDFDDDDLSQDPSWTEEDKTFIDALFSERKTSSDLFATIPDIDYVREQLSRTFTKFEDAEVKNIDILADYDINFVVISNDSSMKSQIALGIAKALNTYGVCDRDKIVRASANDLNRRNFELIFDRIAGGCLIIDNAAELSDQSAEIIEKYVNADNQQTAIVLSSTQDEILEFWKKHQTMRSKFLNVINVSKYNEMELVTLAKGYAEEKKYELDQEAALVLRDYFRKEIENDVEVNYDDVMTIVNMAISNLEKRNMRNLYMTVLDNKYEEAKMFRLLPEDFKTLL